MREHALSTHPGGGSRRASRPLPLAPGAALAAAIGNRGMNALVARLSESSPTSPPAVGGPEDAAIEEGVELTTPGGGGAAGGAAGVARAVAVQNPKSLKIKGSGLIAGSFGISKYWPVTRYWGADKVLGKFDKASSTAGWRMIGHKFQVIGEFTNSTTTTGTGGNVTFKQEARITDTKGGTAGAWFDDMDYTDAGGGKHTWDPNAESGTTVKAGYPGVRRTISKTKYAYTDPPAMAYQKGSTNAYRKLEFRISLQAPPGASTPTITKTATQEIEIVNGKPKVLQAP
jgi:hypothetical protein